MAVSSILRNSARAFARSRSLLAIAFAIMLWPQFLSAEPIAVRYVEGSLHGFLVLRTLDGKAPADGDVTQTVRGDLVTNRLVFHFKDGSLFDQTTVFSQRRNFKLVSYRLTQKGPSFPQPLEMSIDGTSGQVDVRYTDERGQVKEANERLHMPPDLANGMIGTLLKNVRSKEMPKSVSLIAPTPKPRIVKLAIERAGQDPFSLAGSRRSATHYVLKVELGTIPGLIAALAGRQPPDSHVWILDGEVPTFLKSEQPFYVGSPVWRIELASPLSRATPEASLKADERTNVAATPDLVPRAE